MGSLSYPTSVAVYIDECFEQESFRHDLRREDFQRGQC